MRQQQQSSLGQKNEKEFGAQYVLQQHLFSFSGKDWIFHVFGEQRHQRAFGPEFR